jgi:hypothetical protein
MLTKSRSDRTTRVIVLVIGLALVIGCGRDNPQSTGPMASLSQQDFADAVRIRTSFGLRADEAWIRQVAADPNSWRGTSTYGTALTPAEYAELQARQTSAEAVIETVESYGRTVPLEWAGLFIDHQAGGVVAVQFTGHLEEHSTRIGRLISPAARVEMRLVRWSLVDLEAFREGVVDAEAWFAEVDAQVDALDVRTDKNQVVVRVSGRNPLAEEQILEHFGGAGWLAVESNVIASWDGQRGSLRVRAITVAGDPVSGLDCVALPDEPSAGSDRAPTDADGMCRITELGATWYSVELQALREDTDDWVVVGRGRIRIPASSEGFVSVVVSNVPEPDTEVPASTNDERE